MEWEDGMIVMGRRWVSFTVTGKSPCQVLQKVRSRDMWRCVSQVILSQLVCFPNCRQRWYSCRLMLCTEHKYSERTRNISACHNTVQILHCCCLMSDSWHISRSMRMWWLNFHECSRDWGGLILHWLYCHWHSDVTSPSSVYHVLDIKKVRQE